MNMERAESPTVSEIDPEPQGGVPTRLDARKLTPEAERALAEAAARRAEIDRQAASRPKELSGRRGPEPTRYGDWESKGIASDF